MVGCDLSLFIPYDPTMLKLAYALTITFGLLAGAGDAPAAPQEYADSAAQAQGVSTPRKKKLGDVTYRTMWRLQKRVAAMLPKDATLISPVLRLSASGMGQFERTEFKPESWAVAIVGKTVDALVPMRRGGYFELPALPQAQSWSEDAIVMFNSKSRNNWFDVGWQVNLPPGGTLRYTQFGQALAELKLAQAEMPWWDIMAIPEKTARFDAIRACFTSVQGKILVAGTPAGHKLTPHCTLLAFDPGQLGADPAIAFVGGLDFVTLDNSDNYASDIDAL
jgi:hypothetical protein